MPAKRHQDERERKVIKAPDVARRFAVSVTTVHRWLEEGAFEKHGIYPFRTLSGEPRFYEDEILDAIALQRRSGKSLRDKMLEMVEVPKPKIVVIANNKGGVGKTTVCVNLAHAITEITDERILVIDLDPQANTSQHFGYGNMGDLRPFRYSIANVWKFVHGSEGSKHELIGRFLDEIVLPTINDRIRLAPMDHRGLQVEHAGMLALLQIANLEIRNLTLLEMSNKMVYLFAVLPHAVNDYLKRESFDWVFIDTPPTLGALTLSAMSCADGYLTPVEPEIFSSVGAALFDDLVGELMEYFEREVPCLGFVINEMKQKSKLRQEVREAIEERFGDLVFKTVIRTDAKISEAVGQGKPVGLYEPRSRGAEDFRALAREFLLRVGGKDGDRDYSFLAENAAATIDEE